MSTASHANGETILSLSRNCVEILESDDTGARVSWSESFANDDSGDSVLATLKALTRRPTKSKDCVLALGPTWLEMRALSLPQRPKRELNGILQRKATALLGCELGDVYFVAVPERRQRRAGATPAASETATQDSEATRESGAEEPWLLLAMRRSRLLPLLLGLRKQGIRVRRTVPTRLALQAAAWSLTGRSNTTCLAVVFEKHEVAIGVLHDGMLRYHNVIEGDLEAKPALAMMLLQEFKSTEAWWRKSNRGGKIDDIALLGLGGAQREHFERATRSALPGANVQLALHDDAAADSASALLEHCLVDSPLLADVSIPLPWRKRTAITAALLATVAVTIVGVNAWIHFQESKTGAHELARAIERRANELDAARVQNEEARAELARRVSELSGVAATRSAGLRFEDILDSSCTAFGDSAALLRIAASRDGDATTVEIAGRTDSEPIAALENVAHIQQALLAEGLYASVLATPLDSGTPDGSSRSARFSEFVVRAPLLERR